VRARCDDRRLVYRAFKFAVSVLGAGQRTCSPRMATTFQTTSTPVTAASLKYPTDRQDSYGSLFDPFTTSGKKERLRWRLALSLRTVRDHSGGRWIEPADGARFATPASKRVLTESLNETSRSTKSATVASRVLPPPGIKRASKR
jgi:hypothetical protein